MKKIKFLQTSLAFIMLILSVIFFTGCGSTGGETSNLDSTAPTVTLVTPAIGSTNVGVDTKTITAAFSETMNSSTLTTTSFTLECPKGTSIAAKDVSYTTSGNQAILTLPSKSNLPISTVCTATITTAAKDVAGNALAGNYGWTFTTSATLPAADIQTFAVLGGTVVNNTGATSVTGDIAVSPGTSVNGFPPGIVVGTINAGDTPAAQVQSQLTDAYNLYAGKTCGTDLTGQDLGGLTLTPGVYCFSSSAQLTGTLTLNAGGDTAAYFIFKIGSTLTTAASSRVILTNSAQSGYVIWQVADSATLGAATNFQGNILANNSIALSNGVVLEGRALARTGSVTLDTNTITLPATP
jgi:hypothetical protein